jgi:hypothetical protein
MRRQEEHSQSPGILEKTTEKLLSHFYGNDYLSPGGVIFYDDKALTDSPWNSTPF